MGESGIAILLKPNSINNGVFNIEYDIWDKWRKVRHPDDSWLIEIFTQLVKQN